MEEKTAFIVCPVRSMSEEERAFLEKYVLNLESKGYKVHYPPHDTDQSDPNGINIVSRHREVIRNSKEIHIYWNPKSEGSVFDLGMLFMAEKPVYLINKGSVNPTPIKSFTNVVLELDKIYRSGIESKL